MDVFYKQNWASNVKLISFYMIYGSVFVSASYVTRTLTIHVPVGRAGEGYPTREYTRGAPTITY